MSETILVPGGRDVRATLDGAADEETESPADSVVVACPPHPQHRGHRGDDRLVAVADGLGDRGVDCLRFDYGPWDEGRGELADVGNAIGWARERYERVGLFGFSFGAALALLAAADDEDAKDAEEANSEIDPLAAVSALAPAGQLAVGGRGPVDALDEMSVPAQVVVGTRDTTAEWKPVAERARERGVDVVELPADHFFVGQSAKVADAVVPFLASHLD